MVRAMIQRLTLQERIRVLPRIATIGMTAILIATLVLGATALRQERHIREGNYVSVQLRLALRTDLAQIQRRLQDAVERHDVGIVDETDRLEAAMRARIAGARDNPLVDGHELQWLGESLGRYYTVSRAASLRLVNGGSSTVDRDVLSGSTQYEIVRSMLDRGVMREQTRIRHAFGTARALQWITGAIVAIISLGCVLLLLMLSSYTADELTRTLTDPLSHAALAMDSIARGELAVEIPTDIPGEMGHLHAAMQRMVEYLSEMAEAAQHIAVGDLRVAVNPHSERDVFGTSFQAMTLYLQEMANAADRIAGGDLASDFTPRGHSDYFGRAFHSMTGTLNQSVTSLRASEKRFRSLVQNSSDTIFIASPDTTIRYVSASIERSYGYLAESLVGHRLVEFVHADDVQSMFDSYRQQLGSRPGATFTLRARVRSADDAWHYVEIVGVNLIHDPTIGGIVLNTRDITERTELEAQLTHQAFHDPLTSLANRALFRDRVEHALARSRRENTPGIAVLFLDLDDFKTVNDSLGHDAGDELLIAAAARLLNATRGSDTVARLGGDEFAILLENAREEEEVLVVARRVLASLSAEVTVGARELRTAVRVGTSVGIAQSTTEDTAETLLRNADLAMYKAKKGGKNRFEIFHTGLHQEVVERVQLEADLRSALDAGTEFRVVYQPIMDLTSQILVGVEALVRWDHPRRGTLVPAAFIPLAEDTGLIVPLGRWVLREACHQAASWHAERPASPFTVTVNLSARQLHDPELLGDVERALLDSGVDPGSITLEITESVIMSDMESTLPTLVGLKALGVFLAIDDFGTGYSSLSYLRQFPIDVLKIDKSFVDGVAKGGQDSALARTVIALAATLGMRTIAEGIEHANQHEALRNLSCEFGQGYLFARPVPAGDIGAMIARAADASASVALASA
jgi:diguanylate cyclase (GGDEF)-like protein/PAS domain S-box-containing protein